MHSFCFLVLKNCGICPFEELLLWTSGEHLPIVLKLGWIHPLASFIAVRDGLLKFSSLSVIGANIVAG